MRKLTIKCSTKLTYKLVQRQVGVLRGVLSQPAISGRSSASWPEIAAQPASDRPYRGLLFQTYIDGTTCQPVRTAADAGRDGRRPSGAWLLSGDFAADDTNFVSPNCNLLLLLLQSVTQILAKSNNTLDALAGHHLPACPGPGPGARAGGHDSPLALDAQSTTSGNGDGGG